MVITMTSYLLIMTLLLASLFPLAAQAGEGGVQVVGSSKVSVAPDIAHFIFAISGQGKELKGLKADIDSKTARLVGACKQIGVRSKDISSTEVSIRPQYNYQTKEFLGYEVSREVKVALNQLARYTELVNGAIESGITTIRDISLDTTQRDMLERQALSAAVDAAKKKAQALAQRAGVELGKVVSMVEGGAHAELASYEFKSQRLSMSAAQDAFEPGEITVSATVTILYSIN